MSIHLVTGCMFSGKTSALINMAKMNKLLKAALSHYQAQKDEALAVLEVYFESSVGIGEHSNLLKEVTEWTQKLTEAEENIRTLEQKFINKSS